MTVWALRTSWEVDFWVGCCTCQLTDEMWCSVVWCQVQANIPNRLEHFSAELPDMGVAATVICDRTVCSQLISTSLPSVDCPKSVISNPA